MHPLYVVTGASGTGVATSLEKYVRWSKTDARIVKLEDEIRRLAIRPLKQLFPEDADLFDVVPSLADVFRLPEKILRDLWAQALEGLLPSAEESPLREETRQDRPVFLTFHACWYHMESRALMSGVDHDALRKLPSVQRVVVLIDDIYDVAVRLSRENELFDWRDHGRPDEHDEWRPDSLVGRLLKILQWREAEVRYSQAVARSLGVPLVLFAVKHPMPTFEKVLNRDESTFAYLSHPISVPRRSGINSADGQPLVEFINDAAAAIRRSGAIALYEPTTIDEWRFNRDHATDKIVPGPLEHRWPLLGSIDELLWDGLASDAERSTAGQPFSSTPETSDGLRVLSDEINHQINWRDRQLVEQSNHLVMVRPFAGKKLSGGVGVELRLFDGLRRYSVERRADRQALYYHPADDEQRRRIEAMLTILDDAARDGTLSFWSSDARAALADRLGRTNFDDGSWAEPNRVAGRLRELLDGLRDTVPTGQVPRLQATRSGTMEGGQARTQRRSVEHGVAVLIIDAIRGRLPENRYLSLAPFSVASQIEGDFPNGAALGQEITSRLEHPTAAAPRP